jgi:hypothetical protein
MKKIFGVFIIAILVAGAIFGCSKLSDNDEITNTEVAVTKEEPGTKVLISCEGDGCTSGGDCSALIGPTIREWECCEGCYLVIQFVTTPPNPGEGGVVDLEDVDIFYEEFYDYVKAEYETEGFTLTDLLYETNGDGAYYIIYYFTTSDGTEESVLMYMAMGASVPTIVDCRGSCDTPEEKCTEKATINPNGTVDVECGCESDKCKMYINED